MSGSGHPVRVAGTQPSVADLLAAPTPSFSFEFFPPKTDEGERRLRRAIAELAPLAPTFVDVTYGAGGSTRNRTLRIVADLVASTEFTVVAHLTCVGASAAQLREVAADLAEAGVRNILALRGDPPAGPAGTWQPHPDGLTHARELVELLGEVGPFTIGVAAFPEGHPEAPSRAADLARFVEKVKAGASFAITQFFFDAADYLRFCTDAADAGVDIPIIPGVMPVTNLAQIERFAELSGAAFPADLAARLRAVQDDPEAVRAIGVEVATDLAAGLLTAGAPGVHFYTLNRSTATREVHARLEAAGLTGPAAAL